MTNSELLLAISDMMDKKFKSELQPIKNDLQDVKSGLQNIESEVQDVKIRLQNVESEVQDVKIRLQKVENEVQDVKIRLQKVENEVQDVKVRLQKVENKVHEMSLFQENVIMPRLCTIESCYTDTYDRYRNYVDKMEGVFVDVGLLKDVVSDHTRKLQKLA